MNLSVLTAFSASSRAAHTQHRRRPHDCPRELQGVGDVCNVRLNKLKRDGFPHEALPLAVQIASTTIEDGHAVYHTTVTSRSTGNSWVVSYRYRQFLCLKTRVGDLYTCHYPVKCSGSCAAIRELLTELFPEKRLLSSTIPLVTNTRARQFEKVLRYLLGCVLVPGSAMKCTTARSGLVAVVFQFLRVADPLDRRSLLEIYVDNRTGTTTKDTKTDQSQCTICLDDLRHCEATTSATASAVVTLSCHHAFHRDCLFEWLAVETHCPVCRSRVGPEAVTQYCIVDSTRWQWWLAEFAAVVA